MFVGLGQRIGAMSEDKRLEFVSQEMEKVHPGLLDNFEGAVSKVWPADPWAGGATSLHAPGQLTTICVGIERPEGRVHFAGEHIIEMARLDAGCTAIRAACRKGSERSHIKVLESCSIRTTGDP